jgi:hypothetical protein
MEGIWVSFLCLLVATVTSGEKPHECLCERTITTASGPRAPTGECNIYFVTIEKLQTPGLLKFIFGNGFRFNTERHEIYIYHFFHFQGHFVEVISFLRTISTPSTLKHGSMKSHWLGVE